jgi:hypothetical protein
VLPHDSLVIAALLSEQQRTHFFRAQAGYSCSTHGPLRFNLVVRVLHMLHARWQAGTLFAPTAEEVAYLANENEYPCLPAQMCGAFFYISVAENVATLQRLLPPCTPAEAESRLHAIFGALRAALETDARGMVEHNPRTGQPWQGVAASAAVSHLKSEVHNLATAVLSNKAGLLLRLRATCGLTAADETAVRRLAEHYKTH